MLDGYGYGVVMLWINKNFLVEVEENCFSCNLHLFHYCIEPCVTMCFLMQKTGKSESPDYLYYCVLNLY